MMETARHSDDQPRFQAVPEAKVQARYDHAFKKVHRQWAGPDPMFSVECKCGDRSPWLSSAGLGHGWHARHRQEAVDAVT